MAATKHTVCTKCARRLIYADERETGICSGCVVKSWTPEKRKAMGKLLAVAFKPGGATDAEKDDAVKEAFEQQGGHSG